MTYLVSIQLCSSPYLIERMTMCYRLGTLQVIMCILMLLNLYYLAAVDNEIPLEELAPELEPLAEAEDSSKELDSK